MGIRAARALGLLGSKFSLVLTEYMLIGSLATLYTGKQLAFPLA